MTVPSCFGQPIKKEAPSQTQLGYQGCKLVSCVPSSSSLLDEGLDISSSPPVGATSMTAVPLQTCTQDTASHRRYQPVHRWLLDTRTHTPLGCLKLYSAGAGAKVAKMSDGSNLTEGTLENSSESAL